MNVLPFGVQENWKKNTVCSALSKQPGKNNSKNENLAAVRGTGLSKHFFNLTYTCSLEIG